MKYLFIHYTLPRVLVLASLKTIVLILVMFLVFPSTAIAAGDCEKKSQHGVWKNETKKPVVVTLSLLGKTNTWTTTNFELQPGECWRVWVGTEWRKGKWEHSQKAHDKCSDVIYKEHITYEECFKKYNFKEIWIPAEARYAHYCWGRSIQDAEACNNPGGNRYTYRPLYINVIK